MKADVIKAIVGDNPELRTAILGNKEPYPITKNEVLGNILRSDKAEVILKILQERLAICEAAKISTGTCRRLAGVIEMWKLERFIVGESEELRSIIFGNDERRVLKVEEFIGNILKSSKKDAIVTVVKGKLQECREKKIYEKSCEKFEKFVDALRSKSSLGNFQEEQVLVKDLREKALVLSKNQFEGINKILDQIKVHETLDMLNRKKGDTSGVPLHSAEVRTDSQNFLLLSCPRTVEIAQSLYDYVIRNNSVLMVSVLESEEAPLKANNFGHLRFSKKSHQSTVGRSCKNRLK
jgi:hypothetical protein